METNLAVKALAALAQEHRLSVFRMLVREGPSGLSAGDIAARAAIAPSTLSHHLNQLEGAGLLRSWRDRRHIFYAVDIKGSRQLLAFLTEDCCQGRPEICGYGRQGGCNDDHDLPQPGVRDLAQCPGDDPQLR